MVQEIRASSVAPPVHQKRACWPNLGQLRKLEELTRRFRSALLLRRPRMAALIVDKLRGPPLVTTAQGESWRERIAHENQTADKVRIATDNACTGPQRPRATGPSWVGGCSLSRERVRLASRVAAVLLARLEAAPPFEATYHVGNAYASAADRLCRHERSARHPRCAAALHTHMHGLEHGQQQQTGSSPHTRLRRRIVLYLAA
jgi:hypothetical protein